ncbi:hypothetical protein [Paracoccus suum]|uniref:hypothetical protein n=1 Tax=Paracoccus suum TaxID=2259340 RepID=UPI0013B06B99|nr:hypothetical protein [Paracoccus suum]
MTQLSSAIRTVVFQTECGTYVAQCLDHDICVQAPTEQLLKDRLLTVLLAEGDNLAHIGAAPEEFHKMWESPELRLESLAAA